jgi:hypothetical protein
MSNTLLERIVMFHHADPRLDTQLLCAELNS